MMTSDLKWHVFNSHSITQVLVLLTWFLSVLIVFCHSISYYVLLFYYDDNSVGLYVDLEMFYNFFLYISFVQFLFFIFFITILYKEFKICKNMEKWNILREALSDEHAAIKICFICSLLLQLEMCSNFCIFYCIISQPLITFTCIISLLFKTGRG